METPMKKPCSPKGKAFPQISRIMANNSQSKRRKDESKKTLEAIKQLPRSI